MIMAKHRHLINMEMPLSDQVWPFSRFIIDVVCMSGSCELVMDKIKVMLRIALKLLINFSSP